MNLKLICASLVGVSSIGGALAGGIYLSKSETTKEESDSNTKKESQTTENKSAAPETTALTPAETQQTVLPGAESNTSSGPQAEPSPKVTSSSSDSEGTETTLST